MFEKRYCVYIVTNLSGTVLYTGVTGNLARRIHEHQMHILRGFTDKYNCTKLVYAESLDDPNAAILREKQIKGWKREKKIALVNSFNPDWKDIAETGLF